MLGNGGRGSRPVNGGRGPGEGGRGIGVVDGKREQGAREQGRWTEEGDLGQENRGHGW